jgi:hypothetical protein
VRRGLPLSSGYIFDGKHQYPFPIFNLGKRSSVSTMSCTLYVVVNLLVPRRQQIPIFDHKANEIRSIRYISKTSPTIDSVGARTYHSQRKRTACELFMGPHNAALLFFKGLIV